MDRKTQKTADAPATVVAIGRARIGQDPFPVIAGPCAVESDEQISATARAVSDAGAAVLRGGAYKSTSTPYAFRGLGREGVRMLAEAGRQSGLPVATQVLEAGDAEDAAELVDALEIGSGSMQDFELLRVVGRLGKPVLLRRGASATLDEWLWAAEYILAEGNQQVVLVERGVRTFGGSGSDMLDISAVPQLKELSHLPVIVDPSHAAGEANRVQPLALAAQGVGADGVIVEVHPDPATARTDGPQLDPGAFLILMTALGIDRLRHRIDQIDRQIVRLLSRRQDLALEIGRAKAHRGLPIYIPDREAELLGVIEEEAGRAGIEPGHVRALFQLVLAESRRLQQILRATEGR
ncbi:MAG TPA: 3-deoxy-7-phosphoheptulonate synthase [Acidimicrobiia bacterium]|jgi:3-deoxy-7-phosphoheptulonate synthase/chorismate mutase-like protein